MKKFKTFYISAFLLMVLFLTSSCGSSLKTEAKREAEKYWLSKLTRCGDSYYRREHFGDRTSTPGKDVYYEMKEPDVEVSEMGITDADKLNGLEWTGTSYLTAKVSRSIGDKEPVNQWTEWANGAGLEGDVAVGMRKEKGQWVVEDKFEEQHTAKTGVEYGSIDCSKIPK